MPVRRTKEETNRLTTIFNNSHPNTTLAVYTNQHVVNVLRFVHFLSIDIIVEVL